ALTSVTWFVLTLLPLALLVLLLCSHYRLWKDLRFWTRGLAAVCLASIVVVPFLLPFYRVSIMYGFVRSRAEVAEGSAGLIDWLVMDAGNRLWSTFSLAPTSAKHALFPGLLPLLLAFGALIFFCKQMSS